MIEQEHEAGIDFLQFEKLLVHTSQLLRISIEIKTGLGKTVVNVPYRSMAEYCTKQKAQAGIYCPESFHLFRQVIDSGEAAVQRCHDSADIMGFPLYCNRELVGILIACKRSDHINEDSSEMLFMEEVAQRISTEIQNLFEITRFTKELSEKYEELNLIYDIGRNLGGVSNADTAIKFIVEESMETIHSDMIVASIPSKGIQVISHNYHETLPIDINDAFLFDNIYTLLMEKYSFASIHTPHIVLNNTDTDRDFSRLFNASLGFMAVPVKLKDSVTGFLYVMNFDQKRPFQTGDVRLATAIAQQISLALTNSELYQNLKDFLISVIKTLVYSIEAKDAYTKGHSERVSSLSMSIAEGLSLCAEEKESLSWASILHDIGKIGVLENILKKEGRLTNEEFTHIKEHPEKGYKILLPIEQLRESLSGIRHHHEKFDGTGYPLGLKGKSIPLIARIIAVADTYDAMTSDRSYRSKMSHEDALAEIERVRGSQLDPEIVDTFLHLFSEFPPFSAVYQHKSMTSRS